VNIFLIEKSRYARYAETEAAIIGGYYKQLKNLEEIITQFGEQACFSLQIIAKIYYKMMRTARGNEAHKLALKLNPFLWHSFEELCNVGEKVDPAKVFQLDKLDSFAMCHGNTATFNVAEPDLIVPGNNANSTPISNGTNMYV
jgi:anaphase-promoting complex subunit 3